MLIELDLDEAKRLKLTINQFLLIKLVLDNVKADSYQNVIHLSSGDIKELIDKAKQGGGFVNYTWKKPPANSDAPKLSYSAGIDRPAPSHNMTVFPDRCERLPSTHDRHDIG